MTLLSLEGIQTLFVYDNYYMFRRLTLKIKTVFTFDTPLCWYVLQGSYQSPCAQLFVVLRQRIKVFGPKRDEVTGEWRKLHNEELNDLYSLPNIVRVVKSRRMR